MRLQDDCIQDGALQIHGPRVSEKIQGWRYQLGGEGKPVRSRQNIGIVFMEHSMALPDNDLEASAAECWLFPYGIPFSIASC